MFNNAKTAAYFIILDQTTAIYKSFCLFHKSLRIILELPFNENRKSRAKMNSSRATIVIALVRNLQKKKNNN